MDSCGQPGKSSTATGTQRLRPSPLGNTSALADAAGAAGGAIVGAGGGSANGCAGGGAGGGKEAAGGNGMLGLDAGVAHDTSMPTIDKLINAFSNPTKRMLLILLEALGAGLLLVLIVWWTMFHGRQGGELDARARHEDETDQG